MLSFLDILQIWPKEVYTILHQAPEPVSYFDVEMLDVDRPLQNGTLYLTDQPDILLSLAATEQTGLIIVNADTANLKLPGCDAALLNTSESLYELLTAVKDRFRERASFLSSSAILAKQALESRDLRQFAQQFASIAQNPVAIYSLRNNRLLAFAQPEETTDISDPILREYIKTGTAIQSADYMNSCRKYLEKGMHSRAPFICETGSGGAVNMLCWHICLDNKATILFCIYEINQKLRYSDHYLALLATDILTSMFRMNPNIREFVLKDNAYYIDKLLQNGFADYDVIDMWLMARQWRRTDTYHVIVAESPRANLNMLEVALENALVHCQCITKDHTVVAIYNASARDTQKDRMSQLTKLMSSSKVLIGVSSECESLLTLKNSYYQAQRALELGKRFMPDHHTYYYDQLYMYDFLLNVQDSNCLTANVHPAIEKLKAYDSESSTQYLDTLRCFIKNNMNKKATATAMFIHANTLNYRLKRICEIGGIDFTDMNELLRLNLSLYIQAVHP